MQIIKNGTHISWLTTTTGIAALLLCSVAFARAPSTQTSTERMAVQKVPSIVGQARMIGRRLSSSPIQILVSLKLRHTAQLDAFLRAVHNPASPEYHHFLTPGQFTAKYGPSRTQVRAVMNYLRSQGLQVRSVASNRLLVRASGNTGRMERAFSTQINNYSHNGRKFFAPAVRPKVPVALAGTVQSIIGLSNAAQLQPHYRRAHIIRERGTAINGRHAGAHRIGGSSHATANSTPSGFSPLQIATAYNWPSITNTANANGVTIAIATAQSTNLAASDYDGFWNQYGLPTHTVQMINVDGSAAATSGTGETTIDVERSGAMAPGATLVVYDANNASLTDFTDTYNKIVTDNTAQVMTTSWGTAESNMSSATMTADDNIFKQASAQGISVFAAAGDNGSADSTSNTDTADFPSSDPYVLAAGGTNLVLTSSNTISNKTAWTNGGGAESAVFSEPTWQTGTGVPQNNKRNTADLSMNADPSTGYSVLLNGSWAVYGGTSFVAPELAGLWADGVAQNSGTRLGQSNSAVYNDANAGHYSSDFHDVTSGSNGAFTAGTGWDHPTGWGTPNATNLINDIVAAAGGSTPPPPTNATPVASNGSVSTNENKAVSGTLSASDSDGDALTFAIAGQPAHGTVSITNTSTGAFTYTPTANYYGSDSFTFTATDSVGNVSNTATESVTIKQVVVSTGCPSGYTKYTGSLSGSGTDQTQPNGSYYYAVGGAEKGILSGPSSADFDLYLYKWSSWYGWTQVSSSTGSTSSESISYNGAAGYYTWDVSSYSGSGSYKLCLRHP